jgi:hypothetical protein
LGVGEGDGGMVGNVDGRDVEPVPVDSEGYDQPDR